jgi:hypothetical protein
VRRIQKPLIAIGLDASSSMTAASDSAFVRDEVVSSLQGLGQKLQKGFDVEFYSFGQEFSQGLKSGFTEKRTDISGFFNSLAGIHANRNLSAVVIVTDGLYNRGANPVYASKKLAVPVIAVATGDTRLHKDAFISEIKVNKQVFLNDQFPVEILLGLNNMSGTEVLVSVSRSGSNLFSKKVIAGGKSDFIRIPALLNADKKGMQKISVDIGAVKGELTIKNNHRDFFVEVIEARTRIALVYDSPHPDIASLTSALESTPRFQVSHLNSGKLSAGDKYDVYILYQVPSITSAPGILNSIPPESSCWFFLGSLTDFTTFNGLKAGINLNGQRKNISDVDPLLNENFSWYGIPAGSSGFFSGLPPVQCPGGITDMIFPGEILLRQKIGTVETGYPLFSFFEMPSRKVCVFSGENIWRWRMAEYLKNGDFRIFDEMICSAAQFLAVRKDPNPFKVMVRERLEEGDPLLFDATLLNKANEPVNTPEVTLRLLNEEGKEYPFVFNRNGFAYQLNAGYFPAGVYDWKAEVTAPQGKLTRTGKLLVSPMNAELTDLTANHAILQQISASTGGEFLPETRIADIETILSKRADIRPTIHFEKRYTELSEEWWLLLLIILLLGMEWALRKRNGI